MVKPFRVTDEPIINSIHDVERIRNELPIKIKIPYPNERRAIQANVKVLLPFHGGSFMGDDEDALTWICEFCGSGVKPIQTKARISSTRSHLVYFQTKYIARAWCSCEEAQSLKAGNAGHETIAAEQWQIVRNVQNWLRADMWRHRHLNEANFIADTHALKEVKFRLSKAVFQALKAGAWVTISGPFQTGKSHWAYMVGHKILLEQGLTVRVVPWLNWVDRMRVSFGTSGLQTEQLMNLLTNPDILFLDDPDKGLPTRLEVDRDFSLLAKATTNNTTWFQKLYTACEERARLNRPVVFIFNQSWEDYTWFVERVGGTAGPAVLARLKSSGAKHFDFGALGVEPYADAPPF